jgi:hypothetical protein
MNYLLTLLNAAILLLTACQGNDKRITPGTITAPDSIPAIPYYQYKENLVAKRKDFINEYDSAVDKERIFDRINDFWVEEMTTGLYSYWKDTPWDFNGTTTSPGEGTIACGFFVTTLLQDMGFPVDRRKLAICASSVMMKSLVPQQRLKNLDQLSYPGFCDSVGAYPKGIYVIGLDFHTGFIVNDGTEAYFIHSNYIGRKGVVKELIKDSDALKASRTKWMVALTTDHSFLRKWLSNDMN